MKKLMIALAVAACAVAVNAASFNWTSMGTSAAKTFYAADGTTPLSSGTIVYLLDSGLSGNSQADLVAGFRNGKTLSDFMTVTSTTLDENSRLTEKKFSYGTAGNDYTFYMVIVSGDDLFVSADKAVNAQASDVVATTFTGIKAATQNAFGDAAYSSAGWYSTGSVPEPTSGLLLLLGVAGLALKRKRA